MVTPNGTVWTLREVDASGEGRYAPQDVRVKHRLVMESGPRLLGEFGARVVADTQYPGLCVEVGAGPRPRTARLVVEAVQTRTLHDMARVWHEVGGEDDISTALSVLADVLHGDSSGPEEDAATESVADAAGLTDADVDLTLEDAIRLRSELDAVIAQLSAAAPSAAPAQPVSLVERAA